MASLCSVVTNLFIRMLGKKGAKLSSPSDFCIRWDREHDEPEEKTVLSSGEEAREVRKQTTEEQKAVLLSIAAWAGARGGKKDGDNRRPDV